MDKEGQEKGFTVSDKRYSGGTKGEERMPSQDKTPLTSFFDDTLIALTAVPTYPFSLVSPAAVMLNPRA